MDKSIKTIYMLVLLSLLIFFINFWLQPGSLNHYSSLYIDFLYPSSWSFTEPPITYSEIYSVSNSSFLASKEPFIDNQKLIKFNYPAKWLIQQEDFINSNEIIKHIQLTSPDNKEVCLIQIWHCIKPVKEFIQDIKKAPLKKERIKDFKVENHKINGYEGYLVTFKYKDIICKEAYLEFNKKIYRIAYYYAGNKWTKEQESNFQTILQSIILKE